MQQRKFLTVERSAYKEPPRASYQSSNYRQTYDTNFHDNLHRYGSNTNIIKRPLDRDEPKMKFSELHKSPSQSGFKSREEYVKGNIARRKGDGMVSNLKSQLQNLKMQVSKLMTKDTDNRSSSYSKRSNVRVEEDDIDSENISLGGYGKQISDTISVTSEKIIDEPLRRLENKFNSANYDHEHYLQLQNDLLKTELRNLKNKYNATKQELREKCQALERKNEYLEVSLRRSEQALTECKKTLQIQLQKIKFQVTRKLQQQYQEDQRRSERLIQPVRDNLGENELVQDKISKLYEELSEKNKLITSMNLDLTDIQGSFEKKSFELKKQVEKNNELSKQFQFSKRQNLRNKSLLETQVNKKTQLLKTVEQLRQKVDSLTKQLNLHNQIATGSEQLQKKYSQEINQYKQNQQKLTQQIFELQNQIKKVRQLNSVHEQQIKHLKKSINEYTLQMEGLSKSLRQQKQKAMEIEENYRRLLDQAKQHGQKQLQLLQQQYDKYRQSAMSIVHEVQVQDVKSKQNFEVKQKQRQVNKWKAEYKMLKLKYQQHFALETTKKEQIESYYKNYKQYKSQNKILEMRNKVLEESASAYIEKIQKIESQNLQQRVETLQKINALTLQNQQLARQVCYQQQQLAQLRNIIDSETERANNQQSIRRDIEKKVFNLDVENNDQLMSIIEKMKKRVADQDEKVNKYIKQLKTKDNLIKQLKKEVRNVLQNQEVELQKFRAKQITECMQQIQSKTFASLQDLKIQSKKEIGIEMESNKQLIEENSKMKGQLAQMKEQILKFRQEVKSISHLYNLKSAEMQQLLDKNQFEASNYSTKLEEMQRIKNHAIKSLQAEIISKNEEIQNCRIEIKKYLSITRATMEQENFDEALKTQIEGSKKLRDELNKKNEQVYRLRDSYATLKAEFDNLKAESDIARLKFISDKKNIQIQFDVQSQSLKSQLNMQQKRAVALEQKIKIVIDENKKKDNFIQTYIMGKRLPTNEREMVATFMKEFEICFTGKQLSEKLQSESQELQKMAVYNFNLMKEIAEMKEKLLMYEAISVDTNEIKQNNFADIDTPKRSLMQSQSISGIRSFE